MNLNVLSNLVKSKKIKIQCQIQIIKMEIENLNLRKHMLLKIYEGQFFFFA
jgi:hypothetical protein